MGKSKLAVIANCLLLYASFASVAGAEEAADTGSDVELEEVIVTADKIKQPNPTNITVVNADEIKAKGAHNAAEALKDVAGIYVTSNNVQGKAIAQFRGSDADNTRVFVDGIPLSPVGDGKVDLRAIPAENIEKIEVIKGVVPVIYGTDAPGGVIYITTRKAGDKSAQAVSISIGSNRDESFFASVAGKKGKFSYLLDAKKEHNDGYTAHTKVSEEYFNGKLNYDISPKASVTVFGSYSEKQQQLANRIDPETGGMVLTDGLGTIGNGGYWAQTFNWEYDPRKNSYAGILFNQKLNGKSDLNLKLYRSNENSHLRAFNWFATQPWDASIVPPDHGHWGNVYTDGTVKGYELQNTIRTSGANTVTWGYVYETRKYQEVEDMIFEYLTDSGTTGYRYGLDHSDYDYTGKSIYVQDTVNVNRKLAVNIGFRHDRITDYASLHPFALKNRITDHRGEGTADKPELSFNYALTGKTFLHGAIGQSYRWPNVIERLAPGGAYGWFEHFVVNGQNYYRGSDGLLHPIVVCNYVLPEEVINREVGLAHTFHSGLKLDLTFFSKDITNMIKSMSGNQVSLHYNIPSAQMHGYEAEISHKIGKKLKGFLNYSYTNAFDPMLGEQVRDIPARKFSYGLNYRGKDSVLANLAFNYMGAVTSSYVSGSGNNTSENLPWVRNLPDYHTVDLKVSKQVNDEEYYVRVTNLFDKKYYQGAFLAGPGKYVEFGASVKF